MSGYNRHAMAKRSLALTLVGLMAMSAMGVLLVLSPTGRARASSLAQAPTPFPTPTPDANGNIIYVVQKDDTAWRIAAVAGISLEELYALNGLQPTDFLTPGMRLTLGKVSPTEAPLPTVELTPIVPTATPDRGSADICVLLFDDQNGNAKLDDGEQPLQSGQVSVAQASGSLVGEQTTTSDPAGYCFNNLAPGGYNVSAAVPPGYNPTTSMNTPVQLKPGDVSYVEFGAQASAALAGGVDGSGGGRSMLLGILGVGFLVAAGVLGYFAAKSNRRSPMSLR